MYYRIIKDKFSGFFDDPKNYFIEKELEKIKHQFFNINYEEYKILDTKQYIKYDKELKKLVSRENTRKEKIEKGIITLETEKNKARKERDRQFKAKNILLLEESSGIIEKFTEQEKREIRLFIRSWLDVPNNYRNILEDIKNFYPPIPDCIQKYM